MDVFLEEQLEEQMDGEKWRGQTMDWVIQLDVSVEPDTENWNMYPYSFSSSDVRS